MTAEVRGPHERLALLFEALHQRAKLLPADLEATLLPKDLDAFDRSTAERRTEIQALLDEGRALVELAERLVCRLCGVPRDLEGAVVAHAVARAAR